MQPSVLLQRVRIFRSSDVERGELPGKKQTRAISPFDKPGWFFAVKNFVQDSSQSIPRRLTGQFLQCNASPSFSLIRFETEGDAIWFKACRTQHRREFPLTVFLSSLPTFATRVLATQPLWNAWVMLNRGKTACTNGKPFRVVPQHAIWHACKSLRSK
jgi:hypothetical protein